MPDEILSTIGQSQLFSGLDEALLQRVAAAATKSHIRKGQTLFQQGDPADAIWGVLSGRIVQCMRSEEGREITVDVIETGEVFGEVAVLDWGTRQVEAVAAADCDLFRIDRRRFLELLQTSPELCFRVFALLCSHVRESITALEETALQKFPARLARRLMTLTANSGGDTGTGVENSKSVVLSISQSELAGMTGVNREAVNRHLRTWEKEGWIRLGRRQIVISDIKRLSDLAAPVENGNGGAGNFDGREGFPAFHDRGSENASASPLSRTQNIRNVGLVAVVIGDYSRDMMADVAGTLKALRAGIRAIETVVDSNGGTIIGQSGDSIIAEFPDSAAGLRAAKLIQDRTAPRPGTATAAKKGSTALFRAGVHAGEIVVDGNRYFGPAINVALHLAQYAGPGDVYISGAVQEHVKDERQTEFSFLGNHRFAGIDAPVAVYSASPLSRLDAIQARLLSILQPRHRPLWAAVAGAISLAAIFLIGQQIVESHIASVDIPASSIVVMPFRTNSTDAVDSVLATGIADQIRTRLARNADFRVIARTSSATLAENTNPAKIREALSVAYMLTADVDGHGASGTIHAKLTDTKDNREVWSKVYETGVSGLLGIENSILRAVSSHLNGDPAGGNQHIFALAPTDNEEAFEAYLRAESLSRSALMSSRDRAISYYQLAIDSDPQFANAYAGLYMNLFLGPKQFLNWPADEPILPLAIRAYELDPGSPKVQIALAHARALALDLEEADRLVDQALSLAPNDSDILLAAGRLYSLWGRERGYLALVERAYARDPMSSEVMQSLIYPLTLAGRLDEARGLIDKSEELEPDFPGLIGMKRILAAAELDWPETDRLGKEMVQLNPAVGYQRMAFLARLGLNKFSPATERDKENEQEINALIDRRYSELMANARANYKQNNSWVRAVVLAGRLVNFGDYENALLLYTEARESTAGFDRDLNIWLGHAVEILNDTSFAIQELQAYQELGRESEASALFKSIMDRVDRKIRDGLAVDGPAWFAAQALAIRGNDEEALDNLRRALTGFVHKSVFLRSNRVFENLHDQPEFWQIVAEVEAELAEVRQQIKAARLE